jgi:hypothetical protein
MTADEQQPQQIIAVIGAVEPIDQPRFGIVDVRQRIVGG